jgi:hypothetical protein
MNNNYIGNSNALNISVIIKNMLHNVLSKPILSKPILSKPILSKPKVIILNEYSHNCDFLFLADYFTPICLSNNEIDIFYDIINDVKMGNLSLAQFNLNSYIIDLLNQYLFDLIIFVSINITCVIDTHFCDKNKISYIDIVNISNLSKYLHSFKHLFINI